MGNVMRVTDVHKPLTSHQVSPQGEKGVMRPSITRNRDKELRNSTTAAQRDEVLGRPSESMRGSCTSFEISLNLGAVAS